MAVQVRAGVLQDGARDLRHIRAFFSSSGDGPVVLPSLVGLTPNAALCGGDPTQAVCATGPGVMVVYAQTATVPASPLRVTPPWLVDNGGSATPASLAVECFDPVVGTFAQGGVLRVDAAGQVVLVCPGATGGHADRVVRLTQLV
jgi:hypothetical protein